MNIAGGSSLPPDDVPQFYWASGLRRRYGQVGRALEGWSGSQTGEAASRWFCLKGEEAQMLAGRMRSPRPVASLKKTQQLVGGSDGPEFLLVLFRTCRIAAMYAVCEVLRRTAPSLAQAGAVQLLFDQRGRMPNALSGARAMSRSASSRLRQLMSVQLAASLERNGALRLWPEFRVVFVGFTLRSAVVVHLLNMASRPQKIIMTFVVPKRCPGWAGSHRATDFHQLPHRAY